MKIKDPGNKIRGEVSGAQFNTTHWSVVLLAGQTPAKRVEAALDSLCRSYWFPLYAYVRRKGYSSHDAQDLTQEFFARLLEKNYIRLATPERGKFRSFLLKSLNHFLVNDWIRNQAQKRGGGQKPVSFDEELAERLYQGASSADLAAETLYDKGWAIALLETAIKRLGAEYSRGANPAVYERLKGLILAEMSREVYQQLAVDLKMSEGAIKVALHRMRARFRQLVRDEVAQTVATPADIDEELRCLRAALNSEHA